MATNLVPQGIYRGRAVPAQQEDGTTVYAQFGLAKTGTKQCMVIFQILDGPQAGMRLPWFGPFTENSWKRTLESLRYAGWKGNDLDKIGKLEQEVDITVSHSEWEGEWSARVDLVNLPGQGGVRLSDPMKPEALRQFAAQMRNRIGQVGEVNTAPSTREPTTGGGSNGSGSAGGGNQAAQEEAPWEQKEIAPDDIPFITCDDRLDRRLR